MWPQLCPSEVHAGLPIHVHNGATKPLYYSTVDQSSLSKRFQRVQTPFYQPGFSNQRTSNLVTSKWKAAAADVSDPQNVNAVKSLRPWKNGTGKLHPTQETENKPLLLFNKHKRCTSRAIGEHLYLLYICFQHRSLEAFIGLLIKIIFTIQDNKKTH